MKKTGLFIFCLAGFGSLLTAQFTQGPFNPGTTTASVCALTGGVVLSYSPANNIQTSNNAHAMATHCGCCDDNTNCLNSTNFGFTIPAGATITGIIVEIEKYSDFGSNVQDNQLFLLKAGTYVGINHANLWTPWAWTDTYSSYGSCTDLWGDTWTPADINAANFGVVFATIDYTCGPNVNSFIDHVRLSVCYDLALPVHMVDFEAEKLDQSVQLSWKTLSETHSQYFIIEKSSDAKKYFQIGRIPAAGNSNTTIPYQLIDSIPFPGENYYRLVQYDFDGVKETFDPVSVYFPDNNPDSFSACWNENSLRLVIKSNENQTAFCTITNLRGENIAHKKVELEKGNNQFDWEIPHVNHGMYIVSISFVNSDPRSTKRIKLIR